MNADFYISSGILELYVAGVLPPEEMRELHGVIAQDPRLQMEVQAIEDALVQYAAVQAENPPASLLPGIMEKIQAMPEPQPEPKTVPLESPRKKREREKEKARAKEEAQDSASGPVNAYTGTASATPIEEKRSSGSFGLWAAILTIFLLLSIGGNVYLYREWQQAQQQLADAQSDRSQMANSLQAVQNDLQEANGQLQVYQNPQFMSTPLKGMSMSPNSRAMVYWNPRNKIVYLKLENLPAAPDDKQYQLWALDQDKNPVNIGMVPKNMLPGRLMQMKPIGNAVAFAITLEPMGGSEAPTMDQMYVMGNI